VAWNLRIIAKIISSPLLETSANSMVKTAVGNIIVELDMRI
jgi:hypothetical protein